MKSTKAIALACTIIVTSPSLFEIQAQEAPALRFVLPESLKMGPTPIGEGLSVATVAGNPAESGSNYVLYAKYAAGAKSVPHTHRDQRVMTVLSGTFYVGAGPQAEEAKMTALKPGSMIIVPPNSVHWGWAKDGEVILEEVGIGPSNTVPWPG